MKKTILLLGVVAAGALLMAADLSADVILRGGTPAGVPIQGRFDIHQDQMPNANDLHFRLWQKEPKIRVNGWFVHVTDFWTGGSGRAPDNPEHAVDFDVAGALIPQCNTVTVTAIFFLSDQNTLRIKNVQWTGSKDTIKAAPDFGWTVDNPGDMRGGAFTHRITIYNDDEDSTLVLGDIKFLATDSFYCLVDTLTGDTCPLSNILFDTFLPGEDTLAPGQSFTYDLQTATDLVGGHIYGQFIVNNDTLVTHTFDHPVITDRVPALTDWGLLVLLALLILSGIIVIRHRRRAVVR